MTSLWTDRPNGGEHDWFAQQLSAPPRRQPAPPPPPPPRRRRGRRIIAGAVAGVVLAAAVVTGTQLDRGGPKQAETAGALPANSGRPAETRINQIYERVNKGVVSVQVSQGGGQASGTGFVIDADGTIVTNAHVVGSSSTARVKFDDGDDPVDATIVGTDPSSDLAILHVDPAAAGSLHPLTLADSDTVRVGDTAIAIGYPLGLDRTATAGIISGLGRKIEAPNGFSIDKVIQTDAPINPGNSGGPLIDARGRVIGVNSQIATAGGSNGNVGIGFAVPSNTVRQVIPQLKRGRSVTRPFLGVSTSTLLNGSGAVVRSVTPSGPAEKAGFQASSAADGSDGDTIVSINGIAVSGPEDVAAEIAKHEPGDEVDVTVRRGGSEVTLKVKLDRRPDSAPAP